MAASLSKVYDWGLVIDEQELRRLVHEMAAAVQPGAARFAFTVRLSDGFSYSTGNIEEVLQEENRQSRRILGLTVQVEDDQRSMIVAIGTEEGDKKKSRVTVQGEAR